MYELAKEVIEFLDRTEPGYYREKVSVTADGKTFEAEAYVSQNFRDDGRPDPEYVQSVLDGAREFGLDEEYLKKIEDTANQVMV